MNPCTHVGAPRVVARFGGMVLEPESSSRATVVLRMIDTFPEANSFVGDSVQLKKIPQEVSLPVRKLQPQKSMALLMARDNDLPNPAMNGSSNSSHRRSNVTMPHDRRVPKPKPRPALTRGKSTRNLLPTDNDLPSPAVNGSLNSPRRDTNNSMSASDSRVSRRRASVGPDARLTLVADSLERPDRRRRSTSLASPRRMGDNSFSMDYDSNLPRPSRSSHLRNSATVSRTNSVHNLSLLSDNDLSLRARKKAVKPQSAHRVSMLPDNNFRSGVYPGAASPKRESPTRSSLLKRAGFFLSKPKKTEKDANISDVASSTQST